MPRIAWRDISRGLWVNAPKDAMPQGSLVRMRGVMPLNTNSLRSRNGSTVLYAFVAHGLFRFGGVRFQQAGFTAAAGADRELRRNGVDILSNLQSGQRLTFAVMQMPIGSLDYLFVAGTGDQALPLIVAVPATTHALSAALAKVSGAGAVTRWGIQADPSGVLATLDNGAGVLNGVYRYNFTYKNSVTNTRSNSSLLGDQVTAALVNRQRRLFFTVPSPDSQIDRVEIWRTVGNGSVLFKLTEQAGYANYDDNNPDSALTSEELPRDNTPPHAHFLDAVGPYQGRMWYGRIDANMAAPYVPLQVVQGAPGRLVYSPIGRPESAQGGFVELSDDTDAVQKLVIWGGSLWAFCTRRVYQIVGTDQPFQLREQFGIPGTAQPYTVVATPMGIFYEANDGIRVFDGGQSKLVGDEAIGKLFRGENAEDLVAFAAGDHIACWARGEYFISDGTTTLAVNVETGAFRNPGVGFTALYYENDTDVLAAAHAGLGNVVSFEAEGSVTDGGAGFAFEVETSGVLVDIAHRGLVQRLYFDLNTGGQAITPRIVIDGVATALAAITSAARAIVEVPVGSTGRVISVRLTGTPAARVELFGVEMDLHPATPAMGLGA